MFYALTKNIFKDSHHVETTVTILKSFDSINETKKYFEESSLTKDPNFSFSYELIEIP